LIVVSLVLIAVAVAACCFTGASSSHSANARLQEVLQFAPLLIGIELMQKIHTGQYDLASA
jgi:hypothetical protein